MNKTFFRFFLLIVIEFIFIACSSISAESCNLNRQRQSEEKKSILHMTVSDFQVIQNDTGIPISILENFQSVIDKFGEPIEIYNPNDGDPQFICLDYGSFVVYYHQGLYHQNILWLRTFDKSFSTPRSISVGDKISKVFKLYNEEDLRMTRTNEGETFCNFQVSISTEASKKPPFIKYLIDLRFFYKNEIINRIEIQFYEDM